MLGSQRTFDVLTRTANRAAIAVLRHGLQNDAGDDKALRRQCAVALAGRPEPESADVLLDHWRLLDQTDIDALRPTCRTINAAVGRRFAAHRIDRAVPIDAAIDATLRLYLLDRFASLVDVAESDECPSLRRSASEAILTMVRPIGIDARNKRPVETIRGPVLTRLLRSVLRYPAHQNHDLIDAFLTTATWADSSLQRWLATHGQTGGPIVDRFQTSDRPGVIELLAGFLRRPRLPFGVADALCNRTDRSMATAILETVGDHLSDNAHRHLTRLGLPRSLHAIAPEHDVKPSPSTPGVSPHAVAPEHRLATVHIHSASSGDFRLVLPIALHALDHWGRPATIDTSANKDVTADRDGTADIDIDIDTTAEAAAAMHTAIAAAMNRCDVPDELWTIQTMLRQSPGAELLHRLIDLLDYPEPAIAKAARRLLAPLHADSMLSHLPSMDDASARRFGQWVMRIDPNAIAIVRRAMRHPVMRFRIEAIRCVEAMASAEPLKDSLMRMALDDHQAVRIRAALAMASARDDETMQTLRSMLSLPDSQVRDAATQAIQIRRSAATAAATAAATVTEQSRDDRP